LAYGAGRLRYELATGFKVGGTAGLPINNLRVGTDGELITWDASGDPAAVAVGTATHVLTSNGTGAAPTFQAAAGGGAWTLIGTQDASDSATLTQTGIDTTYDMYAIALSTLIPASDSQQLRCRVGDSAGIDSGGSDYEYHTQMLESDSATYQANPSSSNDNILLTDSIGNATGESGGGMLWLSTGGNTVWPLISGVINSIAGTGIIRAGQVLAARRSAIALTQIRVYFANGNIASGRMTVWGISHA